MQQRHLIHDNALLFIPTQQNMKIRTLQDHRLLVMQRNSSSTVEQEHQILVVRSLWNDRRDYSKHRLPCVKSPQTGK